MNTISLKRIKLLLLADWYELKEYYLFSFLAIGGVFLIVMLNAGDFALNDKSLTLTLTLLLLATFALGMTYVSYRSNSVKGLGMLTPARPIEKFLAQLLVLLILLLSGIITYFLLTEIYSVINGESKNDTIFYAFQTVFSTGFLSLNMMCLMMIFWLGCISFKKKAQAKSLLIVVAISYVVIKLVPNFFGYLMDQNGLNYDDGNTVSYIENVYPGVLGIIQYRMILFVTFILTMGYIGYLKLKEKEQR